jgi:hypothetical protein
MPQLDGSLRTFAHELAHSVSPPSHEPMQRPLLQLSPIAHIRAQPPQLRGSVSVLTQRMSHTVMPRAH